ncbi:MAG: response regulator [Thermomicrobiales bacterium]
MSLLLLVVEDEIPIREVLCSILEDEGYRVVGVGDGRAALAALAADRYDLILSDMMMPRLGGADLAQSLADDPALRAIPLILMSALKAAPNHEVPRAAFLPKPFDLYDLLDTVDRVLSEWQSA